MKYLNEDDFNKTNIFGKGIYNEKFADFFVGNSFLNFLVKPGIDPIFIANVTFEPGCRNAWHIHKAKTGGGQILICTAGEGFYQEFGKEIQNLKEGSIVIISPNIKHWHGARKDSWFSHISIEIPGIENSNEWLEKVDNNYYEICHK